MVCFRESSPFIIPPLICQGPTINRSMTYLLTKKCSLISSVLGRQAVCLLLLLINVCFCQMSVKSVINTDRLYCQIKRKVNNLTMVQGRTEVLLINIKTVKHGSNDFCFCRSKLDISILIVL